MLRPFPYLLLLTALAALAPAAASASPEKPGGDRPVWTHSCSDGGDRQCHLTLRQRYDAAIGKDGEVAVTLRRSRSCVTLHVAFDAPVAAERPAWIAIDDGARLPFYTEAELTRLARAVDADQEPAWGPDEFRGFYAEVKQGRVTSAGNELVARFARVKDSHGLGLACAATARLMPDLARGRVLTIEFTPGGKGETEPYHWPRMATRRVSVPLEGMTLTLDSTAPRD
ncbi:hypothetical protein [Arenibaculum pallidiluteum]|uniref:hypothetical protein n=1 Tax=Arenibaculum pallidiluteum TaxID=2812559 RepID=UPI001A95B5C3|nr:hypothetical protein [Arenibaculum pallidiluteum]